MSEAQKTPEPQTKAVTPKKITEPVFAFDEDGAGFDEGVWHTSECCEQQDATGLCICEANAEVAA